MNIFTAQAQFLQATGKVVAGEQEAPEDQIILSRDLVDEEYQNPQGNRAHWRGIVLKNEVKDGRYDCSFLSLDYMLRAYS